MLFFYHLHIFAVSPTLNQPNKTRFEFVSTQRVPYMYPVLVRARYGYFTIFGVPMLHSSKVRVIARESQNGLPESHTRKGREMKLFRRRRMKRQEGAISLSFKIYKSFTVPAATTAIWPLLDGHKWKYKNILVLTHHLLQRLV
jgi:hypothetical protein